MPIKPRTATEGSGRKGKKGKKEKKKKKRKSKRNYRSQNIRIINVFLDSLLSESSAGSQSISPS